MTYFFTADYHLGHANIIKYCNRPFKTLEKMNKEIIRRHNERVKKEDTVFHLGDFCFHNSNDVKGEGSRKRFEYWRDQLNGNIIFVKGNHDHNNGVKTIMNAISLRYGGVLIWCTHKSEDYNPEYDYNFVGHSHEKWLIETGPKVENTSKLKESIIINVGVDQHNFYPITFHEVMKIIRKYIHQENIKN